MYCLVPEKPLRLVYGTFYLAIGVTFYESIKLNPAWAGLMNSAFYEFIKYSCYIQ